MASVLTQEESVRILEHFKDDIERDFDVVKLLLDNIKQKFSRLDLMITSDKQPLLSKRYEYWLEFPGIKHIFENLEADLLIQQTKLQKLRNLPKIQNRVNQICQTDLSVQGVQKLSVVEESKMKFSSTSTEQKVIPNSNEKIMNPEKPVQDVKIKQDIRKLHVLLDQINNENFALKSSELRELLVSNPKPMSGLATIDDEKQTVLIDLILSKVQNEHQNSELYVKICKFVLDLEMKGVLKEKTNANLSEVRKKLINHCNTSFQNVLKEQSATIPAQTAHDATREKKLKGIVEFSGDLYRQKIIPSSTIWQIFDGLIGVKKDQKLKHFVTDNTIEIAIKLIIKLGPHIEGSLQDADWKIQNESSVKNVFNQFELLVSPDSTKNGSLSISLRVKSLIKNMLSQWNLADCKYNEVKSNVDK